MDYFGFIQKCVHLFYMYHPSPIDLPMVKRILVALDQDADTPVAVDYAFDVAHRNIAEVTGLAVVDVDRIESTSSGGGIGSMYYAEKLREKLTNKTRIRAQELVDEFSHASKAEHIPYQIEVQEGTPSKKIIEELKYHDILFIGNNPHFFYGHPDQTTTTLGHVVKKCVAPVIIVPDNHSEITCAVLAYDGSNPSVKALQRFAQLSPFGRSVVIHVVSICDTKKDAEAEMKARQATKYLERHGYEANAVTLHGDKPHRHILSYAEQMGAELIIAGAHSVSMMHKLAFGSTTETLVEDGRFVLFLDR